MPSPSPLLETAEQPALDPLALPAETEMRFNLLLAVAIVVSLYLGVVLTGILMPRHARQHVLDALDRSQFPAQAPADLAGFRPLCPKLRRISKSAGVGLAYFFALPVPLLGLATLLYWTHPRRVRRRHRLLPLKPGELPELQETVRELIDVAGLAEQPPRVELGANARSTSGQAFGFRGRYVIRLDRGASRLLRKAPEQFRAVVLHEMAHIANGDIRRTYFGMALWRAVVWAIAAPLIASMATVIGIFVVRNARKTFAAGSLGAFEVALLPRVAQVLLFLVQIGVLLAIVAAARASLLRARELLADGRAAIWGMRAALLDIMQARATPLGEVVWWRRPWRLHPPVSERVAALRDPSRLFQTSPGVFFMVGVLMAFAIPGAIVLMMFLALATLPASIAWVIDALDPRASPVAIWGLFFALIGLCLFAAVLMCLPPLGLASLVAGTLGAEVQREALADLLVPQRGRYGRLWMLAATTAVGMEVGFLVTPIAMFSPRRVFAFVGVIGWLASVTAFTWLCLVYARYFAQRVLGACTTAGAARRWRRVLNLLLSAVLCVFYVAMLAARLIFLGNTGPKGEVADIVIVVMISLAAVLLYGLVFGVTWCGVELRDWMTQPRCPHCGAPRQAGTTIGRACEYCGQWLATWAMAPRRTRGVRARPNAATSQQSSSISPHPPPLPSRSVSITPPPPRPPARPPALPPSRPH